MEKRKKEKYMMEELSNTSSSTNYILFSQVTAMQDCIETRTFNKKE